jgi:hypothetical protein
MNFMNGKSDRPYTGLPISLWGVSLRELTDALVEIARALPAPVVNVTVAPTLGERVVVTKHDAEGRILEFEKRPLSLADSTDASDLVPVDLAPEDSLPAVSSDRRSAIRQAGHAVAALYFKLPLSGVEIRTDGTGHASYARHLVRSEAQRWAITTFAGPEAEHDACGGETVGTNDMRAIAAMVDKLGLDWDQNRLGALRARARHLVERERDRIARLADALVDQRYLSGEACAEIVTPGAVTH